MNDAIRNRLTSHGVEARGGGWYQLPDGDKVRGADAALSAVSNGGRGSTVRRALNDITRDRFAQLAGLQYDDERDVYQVAGYPTEYTFSEGWSRYKRQDVARPVVDKPVDTTWRHPPEIVAIGEEESEFAQQWKALADRIGLISAMKRADRLASIGEFSVLFIGASDATTDRALKTKVEGLEGPGAIAHVEAYKQSDVTVATWVNDPSDPRHRLPESYWIDFSGDDKGAQGGGQGAVKVHWSRVIHIVEDPLDNETYGLPRLERFLNRLIDMEKVCAATGEAYWQLAARILTATIDPEADLESKDSGSDPMDDLDEDLKELIHGLRRHFLAQGIDLEYLGGETPDPSDPADLFLTLMAAAAGIPKRILFGSETGERASTEDRRQWHSHIRERQNNFAEPAVLRKWTDRMIEFGVLEAPPDGYEAHWPPLSDATEEEESEADLSRAETAKALTPVGGDPMERVRITDEGRVELVPTSEEAA